MYSIYMWGYKGRGMYGCRGVTSSLFGQWRMTNKTLSLSTVNSFTPDQALAAATNIPCKAAKKETLHVSGTGRRLSSLTSAYGP